MAGANSLVGGSSQERVGRVAEAKLPPPLVGVRFVGMLMLAGAVFVGAGYWKISRVFEARDLEMEASRKQELAQRRREQLRTIEGRVSELRRVGTLSAAGLNALGMQQTDLMTMETVRVAPEVQHRWEEAARLAAVLPETPSAEGGAQQQ